MIRSDSFKFAAMSNQERRDWPFEDDDDHDAAVPGAPELDDPRWSPSEPFWLGFMKALGVGLLFVLVLPFMVFCIVAAIVAVLGMGAG